MIGIHTTRIQTTGIHTVGIQIPRVHTSGIHTAWVQTIGTHTTWVQAAVQVGFRPQYRLVSDRSTGWFQTAHVESTASPWAGSHLGWIPLGLDPTCDESHLRWIPLERDPTNAGSHLR